jgi:hypothetical protein
MKLLRIKPSNNYWLTIFLRFLLSTTDYDLLSILEKIKEENEQLYIQNQQQSEIIVINLESKNPKNETFVILIDFTVIQGKEWKQIIPSLQGEISRALTEGKTYICFECQVEKKHLFYSEIHKLINTGTKLECNLREIYDQIFFPFDTSSPPRIEQIFFHDLIPDEVRPDMRFNV